MGTLTYTTSDRDEAVLAFAAQQAGLTRALFVEQFVGSALAQLRVTLHAAQVATTSELITEALAAGAGVDITADAATGFPVSTRREKEGEGGRGSRE